jgi:hypothetical protein
MIIGNPVIMGGGGTLKWNIATGETAPPVLTNGLWVETATPLEDFTIIFDSSQPATPANNTLFFRYYPGYPAAEPIQDQTGIVYDLVACQIYTTTGGWQNVNAYREENGEWVQFAQSEYCLYVCPSGNTLQKITRDGTEVWSAVLTGSDRGMEQIQDVVLDPINRFVYVLCRDVNGGYWVFRVNADTGASLGDFGPGYTVGGTVDTKRALALSRDLKTLVASAQARTTTQISWYATFDVETMTGQDGVANYNFGSPSLCALPDETIYGIGRTSSTSFRFVKFWPDTESIGSNTFTATNSILIGNSSGQFWQFPSASTSSSSYQYFQAPGIRSQQYSFDSNLTVNGATILAYGDVLLGSKSTLYFCTVSSNGTLSKYKSIMAPTTVSAVGLAPDGTVYFATKANSVYRLNSDDTYTRIATTTSQDASGAIGSCYSVLCVEPASITTFPELFQS